MLQSAIQRAAGGGTEAFPELKVFIGIWITGRFGQMVAGVMGSDPHVTGQDVSHRHLC